MPTADHVKASASAVLSQVDLGGAWEAGLYKVLVVSRLRTAWPSGRPELPGRLHLVRTKDSLPTLLTSRPRGLCSCPPFPRQERLPFLDYKVNPYSSLNICHKRQLLYGPLPISSDDSLHSSFMQTFNEGHYVPGTVITQTTHLLGLWIWVRRQTHKHNKSKKFYCYSFHLFS